MTALAAGVPAAAIPLGLKVAFTLFMAVLVPVYWANYGPTNFLYFCDVALFMTLVALWTENRLLASAAAVGILLPQFFWCIDFCAELAGFKLTGMTSYMMDSSRSLFLRGLSLFHGWLPFLLAYLVLKLGYDPRALKVWTVLAVVLCLVAYYFLPPAGAVLANPKLPRNVNYVFGLDETKPQAWLSPGVYLTAWLAALFAVIYLPTHALLKRAVPVEVRPALSRP